MLNIFISHADADLDGKACQDLDKALTGSQSSGALRLWHPRRVQAGGVLPTERAEALRRAHVVVVLLSVDWVNDDRLRHEVAWARQRGTPIMPVYWRKCLVKGTPVEGLAGLPQDQTWIRTCADPESALVDVAGALMDLADRPAQDGDATVGDFLRAALRLDRQPQWRQIEREHRLGGSVLFYLHGHWDQHVSAFAWRLRSHFLRNLDAEPHELVTLRLHVDDPRPRSAEQWAMLLEHALLPRCPSGGDLAALLACAAAERPLFVLVGGQPLDDSLLQDCDEALRDFLLGELPRAIAQAAPRHPIRALLCLQRLDDDRALIDRVAGWGGLLPPGAALRFCALPELSLPQRPDIVDYLDQYDPPLSASVKARVLAVYDRMVARGHKLSFEDLTRLLDQHIEGR